MAKQNDKKDYDYDHGYMRLKDMQHWCGNQKFHDDVDKRLADIRKEREKKKKENFDLGKGKNWCGKKPDSIKMEESQLRKIVSKAIKESLSMEDVNSQPQFRQVDNLYDYINQNNIQMRQASKFARVNAIPGDGRTVKTIASDGTSETKNVATGPDKNGNPTSYIVNNVGNPNNQWVIDAATFQKKYVPVQGQPGVFMPKGGPMMAGQINEPISFTAPWGEKMNIDKGGYIMQTPGSQTDIYGISGKDFDDTYRFDNLEESKKIKMNESQLREMIQKIISESLDELSPDYYSANAQKAQNALNGFGGKMMKMFNPNKYNKIQNQAQKFQSYSNDHPDDTYDITSYGAADPMHINNGYQIRNNRTGNVKGFNDANNTIPIRGSVTSNGKYGGEASYLNGMKRMEESQLRGFISKVIRESLNEVSEQANPEQIYRTLLEIGDSMRDYAWVAINDVDITTAIVYLNKATDAWKQVMRNNGVQ